MLKLATKFAPQPAAFERAYRAGFRCAELWSDAAVLAGWQDLVPLACHYPLDYVLHFPNRREAAAETLEQTVQFYRALACRCLVLHQPHADRYAAALLRLEPGLQLAVENHKLTPEELTHWAEHNPGLTLDVEHFWKYTWRDATLERLLDELRAFLKSFADKLRHVHLPGYLPGYTEHRPLYCARDMVFPVLSLLAEFRFGGLIVSEVNPEFQNTNDLRMDVLLFDTWRARHDPLSAAAGETEP
jgi:hypothetical protein